MSIENKLNNRIAYLEEYIERSKFSLKQAYEPEDRLELRTEINMMNNELTFLRSLLV
jgi:hypothetical protein